MAATLGEGEYQLYDETVRGFALTGHARGMLANRVSYWLNTNGTFNF